MCCSEESLEMLEFWFTVECEQELLDDVQTEAHREAA